MCSNFVALCYNLFIYLAVLDFLVAFSFHIIIAKSTNEYYTMIALVPNTPIDIESIRSVGLPILPLRDQEVVEVLLLYFP